MTAGAIPGLPNPRLTMDQVNEIRRRHAKGEKQTSIAADMLCSQTAVSYALRRRKAAEAKRMPDLHFEELAQRFERRALRCERTADAGLKLGHPRSMWLRARAAVWRQAAELAREVGRMDL